MPFQSSAQMKWAFATKQPFAKEWANKTTGKLPKHVKKKKKLRAEREQQYLKHQAKKK